MEAIMASAYDPNAADISFDELMNPPAWQDEFNHMPAKITPETTWAEVLVKEFSPRQNLEDRSTTKHPLDAAA